MNCMTAFQGKVGVVVGGARGIGRAAALLLARQGARVVIQDAGVELDGTGHDPAPAQAVAQEIRELGGAALALDLDVTQPASPRQCVDAALSAFGRIDVGLYAAGVLRERPLLRCSDDDLDLLFAVQARGAFRFAREFAKTLVDQKIKGSLVLSSSPAGFAGTPGHAAIAAAALAVVGFAKTAATELRRHGIRINVLVPTARTRQTEHLPLFRSIRADSLSAEHAAHVACFLLSEAAGEVNGETIGVAGGRTYALRLNESPGTFVEGPPQPFEAMAARLREVLGR
jgi:NAD(P)-dependent dehydrogenase (short-subunit alcohol dehydrogenase family)